MIKELQENFTLKVALSLPRLTYVRNILFG